MANTDVGHSSSERSHFLDGLSSIPFMQVYIIPFFIIFRATPMHGHMQ
jgi:hypothetical protein